MNKSDLIKQVAEKTGLTDRDADKAVETALDLITAALIAGDEVTLTGFGTFSSRLRHARNGVNPLHPEQKIQIPEVRVPKFKAGKALKDALKGKISACKSKAEEAPAEAEEPIEPVSEATPETAPETVNE